jgi:hypothetical protein
VPLPAALDRRRPVQAALLASAQAEVTRFEVVNAAKPAFEGRAFGERGTAEKITARATIAVDPGDPHNAIVADINLAPRNADGRVEATADVVVLRPARPNGILLLEIPNRGRKLIGPLFEEASGDGSNRLEQAGDAGRGFLLSRGYTLVWVGWQGDIAPGAGMRIDLPVVSGVTGHSREEWVFDHTRSPAQAKLTWPAADLDPGTARLTVRARPEDPRQTPSDLSFRYVDPQTIEITRPATGFDASALYELSYTARDPKVMGLGFAAIRDVAAFLRHETGPANPLAAEGRTGIERTIGFGVSQSGRVLRDFLYLGFNQDERLRRHDAPHRGQPAQLHQLSLCPARPQPGAASRPLLPGRPVPVHLRAHHGRSHGPPGRPHGAVPPVEYLPAHHACG